MLHDASSGANQLLKNSGRPSSLKARANKDSRRLNGFRSGITAPSWTRSSLKGMSHSICDPAGQDRDSIVLPEDDGIGGFFSNLPKLGDQASLHKQPQFL